MPRATNDDQEEDFGELDPAELSEMTGESLGSFNKDDDDDDDVEDEVGGLEEADILIEDPEDPEESVDHSEVILNGLDELEIAAAALEEERSDFLDLGEELE